MDMITVVRHYFFEGFETAVVHVRARHGDVPEGWNAKPGKVRLLCSNLLPARIQRRRVQAIIMKDILEKLRPSMAMRAIPFASLKNG